MGSRYTEASDVMRFLPDKLFGFFLILTLPFLIVVGLKHNGPREFEIYGFLVMVILYPLLEEIVFRGIFQPWISFRVSGGLLGVSFANMLTSILFSISHLVYHDPIWALGTFFPSLAFGFCLERYKTLQAPIVLHCLYNAGYFITVGTQ